MSARVENIGGYLVAVPEDKHQSRDVVDPSTGVVVGTIRKDNYSGQLWHVRVSHIPWRRDARGRIPYPGAADSKAKAVAIIAGATP